MKDITIFFRDIRSFILLFLTPILIVLLVGVAFLSTQPSNVPIIVCGEEESTLYENTLSLIKSSEVFNVREEKGDCNRIISQAIKNSVVRAGVVVPREEANMTITILIDNTKPVSTYIESYFNLITKDISQKLINTMIVNLWSNIRNVSDEIDKVHSELVSYSNTLDKVHTDLESTRSDIDAVRNKISRLEVVKGAVSDSLANLESIKSDLSALSSDLYVIDGKIQTVHDTVNASNMTPPLKDELLEELTSVESILNSMREVSQSIEVKIDTTHSLLEDSQRILEEVDLQDVESKLLNIENYISSSQSSILHVKRNIESLADRLLIAKEMIKRATEEYTPYYTEPVNSKILRYFGNKRYIDFVFPTVLVMILMLMSTFLSSTSFIRQRGTGVLKRILISPTSLNFFLCERLVFNAVISLIPLPFILAAGAFILGIDINLLNVIPIVLVCGILSLVFVLLGLIIASFSQAESTAILASLIIVIPMMFLSGTFTPHEALPPALQNIAALMPITISARLIEGLTFYELPFELIGSFVLYLLAYIVVTAVLTRILMMRGI